MSTSSHLIKRLLPAAAVCLLAIAPACGKSDPKPAGDPSGAAATAAEAAKSGAAKTSADKVEGASAKSGSKALAVGAAASPALALMPKDAWGAMVINNPRRLVTEGGYPQVRKLLSAQYNEMAAEMKRELGWDLTDLNTYAELGLNIDKPIAVAAVGVKEPEGGIFFATLGERANFDKTVKAIETKAGSTLAKKKVGDATVMTMPGMNQAAMVIRGDQLVMIGGERIDTGKLANELAKRGAADSLLTNASFASAVSTLTTKRDAIAWIDIGRAMAAAQGGKAAPAVDTVGLERSLAAAEKAQDAEKVARLKRAIANEKKWAAESAKRSNKNVELANRWLGKLNGLAMGGQLNKRAVEVEFYLPLEKGSLIRSLGENHKTSPKFFNAIEDAPATAFHLDLDMKTFKKLVSEVADASGMSLAEIDKQISNVGDASLDRDLFGTFNGELGFAVIPDEPLSALIKADRGDKTQEALGGALYIGLSDGKRLRSQIDRLMEMGVGEDEITYDKAKGSASVKLPNNKQLFVQLADTFLAASTDKAVLDRLVAGKGAGFAKKLKHADLRTMLGKDNIAGRLVLDQLLAAGMFLISSSDMPKRPTEPVSDSASPEVKKLAAEIDAKEQELYALYGDNTNERVSKQIEKLGRTVQMVRVEDGGMRAWVGQYIEAPSVAELVGSMVQMTIEIEKGRKARYTKQRAVERQIRNLRNRMYKAGQKK